MEVNQLPMYREGLDALMSFMDTSIKCIQYDDKKDYNNPNYKVEDSQTIINAYTELEDMFNTNLFLKDNMHSVSILKNVLVEVVLEENIDTEYKCLKEIREAYAGIIDCSKGINDLTDITDIYNSGDIDILEESYNHVINIVNTLSKNIIERLKIELENHRNDENNNTSKYTKNKDIREEIRKELRNKEEIEVVSNPIFKYIKYSIIGIGMAIGSVLIYRKFKKE